MPNRNFSSSGYRYGMNGQESDDEINGVTGSLYHAKYWEYDARVGRRWNIDPVVKSMQSPYLCFSGNPILRVDIKGDNDWVPGTDAEGNLTLTAEKGDNVKSLKRFFRTPDNAKKYLNEDIMKMQDADEFNIGEKITLKDNPYSRTIKAANKDYKFGTKGYSTYDCKEFCARTVLDKESILDDKSKFDNAIMDSETLAEWSKLWNRKNEISDSEQKPLETFTQWGFISVHAAVYFGKDNSGNEYWVTKNGQSTAKPTVMSTEKLSEIYWLNLRTNYQPAKK